MCFECAIYWGNVGIAGKGEKGGFYYNLDKFGGPD